MVFFKPAKRRKDQTDTLTVGFIQPGEELKELDRVQIDGYFYKHDKHNIIKVKFCDCDKSAKNNDVLRSIYLQRSSKLTQYLKSKKFPKKKIELE
ncbi:MAG: hypothetical protein SGJ15_03415 [Bacteroidota bacterium]|nr:hypothetical protein [Bacteroidota bacterium]